jgi:hypothetical protein
MRDQPTVRATGPADLLALVPGFLGFHPEDSVVVMTIGAASQPFHARVDLPGDPVAVEDLAAYLAEVAARNGVVRAALLLYTHDTGLAETVAGELAGRLHRLGVEVVCCIRADGHRWWDLGRHHADDPGTVYDLRSHPLMARTVLEGTVVLDSRQQLADTLVGSDPDETARVAALSDEVVARLSRHRLGVDARWVGRRVRRFLEDGERLDAQDAARLATLVSVSVALRDVAWAEMSRGTAREHVTLWRDLVRRVPHHLRAAPAALLGFAAWLAGDGALAWCAVECAKEVQPDYGLAALLTQALAAAVPPSSWQPIPPDSLPVLRG